MVKIYCPSCRSYYVGVIVPNGGDSVTVLKCRECGETWKNIKSEEMTSIGMLTDLMKDTFRN